MTLGISHHSSMLGFLNYMMKLPSISGKLSESVGEPRSNSQVSENRFFSGLTPLASATPAKVFPPTANDPDDPDTLRPAHSWRQIMRCSFRQKNCILTALYLSDMRATGWVLHYADGICVVLPSETEVTQHLSDLDSHWKLVFSISSRSSSQSNTGSYHQTILLLIAPQVLLEPFPLLHSLLAHHGVWWDSLASTGRFCYRQ